jgi:hypothetical protein
MKAEVTVIIVPWNDKFIFFSVKVSQPLEPHRRGGKGRSALNNKISERSVKTRIKIPPRDIHRNSVCSISAV